MAAGAWFTRDGQPFTQRLVAMLSNWDAQHYLRIAREGYSAAPDAAPLIVFFPLYPLGIALLFPFFGLAGAAFAFTTAMSVGARTVLPLWLEELELDAARGRRVLALLCAAPIAVYFTSFHTEALYLFLTVLFAWRLQRRSFASAAVCGFLAALTRNMGALFVIPYIAACLRSERVEDRVRRLTGTVLIGAGTLLYLGINLHVQGDAFAFSRHMRDNWYKEFQNPLVTYAHQAAELLTGGFRPDPGYELLYFDRVFTLLFPLLFVDHFRRPRAERAVMPPGFLLWTAAQYLVVCGQSFWVSNTRYLFVILPAYLLLERACRARAAFIAWMTVSSLIALWAIRNYAVMTWVF